MYALKAIIAACHLNDGGAHPHHFCCSTEALRYAPPGGVAWRRHATASASGCTQATVHWGIILVVSPGAAPRGAAEQLPVIRAR